MGRIPKGRAGLRSRRALALFLMLAPLFLFSDCFAPTYSDCAFRCGPSDPLCPDEYECRGDGYCHLPSSVVTCAMPDLAPSSDGMSAR